MEESPVFHVDKVLSHLFIYSLNRLLPLPVQRKTIRERLVHFCVLLVLTNSPIEFYLAHLSNVWIRLSDKFDSCEGADTALGVQVVALIFLGARLPRIVQTQNVVLVLGAGFIEGDAVHLLIDPLHLMDGTVWTLHLLQ